MNLPDVLCRDAVIPMDCIRQSKQKEHVKSKKKVRRWQRLRSRTSLINTIKKCGMTGTALTEEKEFREIYGMDVVEVPTNKPVARIDYNDSVL